MDRKNKPKFKSAKKKISINYIIFVFALTFALACLMDSVTDILLDRILFAFSFVILSIVILLGIVFDIVGVAVTSADAVPFHALAAEKVKGAKETLMLLKNAEKVSNICNDVIGDVCGIISGGITAFIVAGLNFGGVTAASVGASMLLSGVVSALTVGGKAIGKFYAISYCNSILFFVGRIIAFFKFSK